MATTNFGWTTPTGWLSDVAGTVSALDAMLAPKSAVLVAGTKAVADTAITANSVILYNRSLTGGTTGQLSYVLNAGVGVTFNSTSGTDTSTIVYIVLKY